MITNFSRDFLHRVIQTRRSICTLPLADRIEFGDNSLLVISYALGDCKEPKPQLCVYRECMLY